MKKLFFFILLLGFSIISHTGYAAGQAGYTRMIVFGDSYSDNGNDFKYANGRYPNPVRYFRGRFSDGPVWAEYFAKILNINPNDSARFMNFAYGQAKILSPTSISIMVGQKKTDYPIPDLAQQIDAYQHQADKFNANDLVVVFISANDFFDIPANSPKAPAFFQTLADQQIKQVQRLQRLGAQHIIVFNGRDVTAAPLARIVAQKDVGTDPKNQAEYIQSFRQLIQAYNQRLAAGLKDNKQVFVYNVFNFDTKTIAQIKQKGLTYKIGSTQYQFTNAQSGCYQNDQGEYQEIAGPVCNEPQAYFFYDRIHTTSYLNQVLANDVYREFMQTRP